MEDQTNPPNRRNIIIIAVVIILVLLGAVMFLTSRRNNTNGGQSASKSGGFNLFGGKKGSEPSSKAQPLISNNEVAKKVLEWLNKQKDERGLYYGQVTCYSNGTCKDPVKTFQSGATSIWGRFKYYEKNKKPQDLQVLLTDIGNYANRNKVLSLQNYFWNCKLMYELWQSKVFNEAQKSQIKSICFDSQDYPPPDNAPSSLNINLGDIMENKNVVPQFDVPAIYMQNYAFAVSDNIVRAQWDNDSSYINSAKDYFNYAVLASLKKDSTQTSYIPLLGIAALDLYNATKDGQYLQYANFIYNNEEKKNCDSKDECLGDVYLANQMHLLSNDSKYVDYAKKSIDLLVSNSFDYPGYAGYKTGIGAFRPTDSSQNPTFSVIDNGFIIGLLTSN